METLDPKKIPGDNEVLMQEGWVSQAKKNSKTKPAKPLQAADPKPAKTDWQNQLQEGWNKSK